MQYVVVWIRFTLFFAAVIAREVACSEGPVACSTFSY